MAMKCAFVTDLHGFEGRYRKLFEFLLSNPVEALFIGGDILPNGQALSQSLNFSHIDFINDFLRPRFLQLKEALGERYPAVFIILGNDDGRLKEIALIDAGRDGLWHYLHDRRMEIGGHSVLGYSYIPPSPFLLKDWERYDVSRYVDPGSVSPEEGYYSIPVSESQRKFATIKDDLENLAGDVSVNTSIFLFHAPPYKTNLDRAALDGKMIDSVPFDVHVGSIAVQRFIEQRQPLITLHGHVHESSSITGSWQDRIGETYCFSAAYDGPELAVVLFDSEHPESAERLLL
ncbi:MAG: hypothetical protein R3F48_17310 [Candidatus Zixiibacteriota bacterium]